MLTDDFSAQQSRQLQPCFTPRYSIAELDTFTERESCSDIIRSLNSAIFGCEPRHLFPHDLFLGLVMEPRVEARRILIDKH